MPHLEPSPQRVRQGSILKQQQQQQQQQPPPQATQLQRDENVQYGDTHELRQQSPLDTTIAPHAYLGLVNRACSPRTSAKSVSIAHYAETISPLILGQHKSVEDINLYNARDIRMPAVKSARSQRLSGRLSNAASPALFPFTPQAQPTDSAEPAAEGFPFEAQPPVDEYELLVDQISTWIRDERAKRAQKAPSGDGSADTTAARAQLRSSEGEELTRRRGSDASDKSVDLDRLEGIVKQSLNISRRRGFWTAKRKPSIRKLRRKPSSTSDSEHHDSESLLVPSCEVVLDNSKTIASKGGAPESDVSSSDELTHAPSYRDHDAWAGFKYEIVRLTHTLRLKGWRRVALDMSSEVTVQRLSGALTNAVYVVSSPPELPDMSVSSASQGIKKRPPKLLLRIYGPQVEHLIDREAELAILQRLARKRIGPRLLGTFANGRFEEYFHAKPLDPEDLRRPETSQQIAKRMRELHDGVELLDQERIDGAFVWRNWDKWLARVEKIVLWMDGQVTSLEPGTKPTGSKTWMRRGFICGAPWKVFRQAIEKYRAWLEKQCGGIQGLREELVFAHNDTQYGNILRLMPTGESPLLLPANTHKQLVVIDFEYASANTQGLEFANHFTEWCYNYHEKRRPYACNTNRYPTPDEQDRFIRAYVRHRPQFNVNTPKLGPVTPPLDAATPGDLARRPTTSISDFILDARTPYTSASGASTDDASIKAAEDAEVARLMRQTRLWRLANTAQWVAWGIVQAKVPGMPVFAEDGKTEKDVVEDGAHELLAERADEYKDIAQAEAAQSAEREEELEEFDYLGYAQHRAMFFWGDILQLGLAKEDDLPEETRSKIKSVPY